MSNRSELRSGSDFDPQAFLNGDTQSPPENNYENTGQEVEDTNDDEVVETSDELEQPTTEATEPEDGENQEGDTDVEETSDDVEALKKELENYKNRYSNAEKLIGKHSQELHELRKFYQQMNQQKQSQPEVDDSEFLDDFIKNPKEALAKELQRRDSEIETQRKQQEQWVSQNTQHVYQSVPDFDSLKDTILEIAREDGIENPTMDMLQQTVNTDPLLAIQYAKRASLKREIEQVRNKGKDTIKKIASNSKKTPTIKGKTQSSSSKELTDTQLRSMSREDIQNRLKELGFYG